MSYIGAEPTTAAFPFDQFSGDGTTTAFTLTYAPASTTSIVVAISGVVQNPNLYSVVGTTLTFSPAPPVGTSNIAVLYLGLPVITGSSPGNTAFLSATDLTATASQTVFASAGSYTPGFVQVFRNGARLGNADFTATNGTTITLANAATSGDLVTIEYYTLTSLTNALPLTGGTVTGSTTFNTDVSINGASASGFTGMKSRIINGAMVIDQRNAGASVTSIAGTNIYPVDRFFNQSSSPAVFTLEQVEDAPVGFINSVVITVTTPDTSLVAGDFNLFKHIIEGLNVADFGWGTASAQPITLSFWVKSSLTGTFSVGLRNSAVNRSYIATYTISAANTWEQKTITVAGDTSGTWLTTNGIGIRLDWNLGSGSDYQGTANSWTATNDLTTSGSVSVVGTSGATFYITGVQLERGTNATSFEFIDYGRQLIQCQRYYWQWGNAAGYQSGGFAGMTYSSTLGFVAVQFPVTMRSGPTLSSSAASTFQLLAGNTSAVPTSITISTGATPYGTVLAIGSTAMNVSAGAVLWAFNTTAKLQFSAEL